MFIFATSNFGSGDLRLIYYEQQTDTSMTLMLVLFGLEWHAWFTVLLIIAMFVILLKTDLPTDMVFLAGMALLLITGTLSPEQALSGFSSSSVVIVGVLFVVIAGLVYTGVLQWIVDHLLGTPKGYKAAVVRLMLPVAALSAFLSNTTVVALFINVVKIWTKKLKIEPSKLFIPLSYAAGMGGICTLIGTPPNLIISSFYMGQTGESLSLFAPLIPGLFCLLTGVVSVLLMSRLLPDRASVQTSSAKVDDSMIYELKVSSHSHLVGQSFAESGLDQYFAFDDADEGRPRIMSMVRFDRAVITNVSQDEFLMGGDHIAVSGSASSIVEICRKFGLYHSIYGTDEKPEYSHKTWMAALIMLGMILLSTFQVMSLLSSCFLAALLMVVCRCCTIKQAKQSINWDVLMVFAGSVCLGCAIEQTGLAEMIANGLLALCGTNPIIALVAICFTGTFVTEFVSNTAAGAIFAPIAYSTAIQLGVNPLTFCVALMISVSSSFATPIGSPTHLMVYGPGGYRFNDFLRIGIPMNLIILVANIFITLLVFPL